MIHVMCRAELQHVIAEVPPGAWAVGVSGGADSVALLRLLLERVDIRPVVVHLNHQMRGSESDGDEQFVGALCRQRDIEFVSANRAQFESADESLPANPSSRYRRIRQIFFANT